MKILFVCLGNICRSPMAEAVMNRALEEKGLNSQVSCDSCGTGSWHVGSPPDYRTLDVFQCYGLSSDHKARVLSKDDFYEFDYLVAMDRENKNNLIRMAPPGAKAKIVMMRDFDPKGNGNVPDPYYGGQQDFEEVYQILKRSCENFAEHLEAAHNL